MGGKSTGGKVASSAGRTLGSANGSALQKSLAGSALSQAGGTNRTTSKPMEAKASAALQSGKSAANTKALAGSLVSQSKK